MAKPAGARCNLRCEYCFFLKKKRLYPESSCRMPDRLMERYIRQTIQAHTTPEVTIAWQGGEPTLMGLEFFRRVVEVEKKYAKPGTVIRNTLQTNGVLLNDKWCEFLRINRFLVGLSIDGPRACHDAYRKNPRGESVFEKVVDAAGLLQQYEVDCNILCTVNSFNSRYPLEVYRFFRDQLRTPFLQFIPIVERDNTTGNQEGERVTDRSVNGEAWGDFLIAVFDEWVRRDVGSMFVQFFDGVLASYVRGYSSLCILRPTCGEGVALEHTGDVYSCDHYVQPDHLLGNIRRTSIEKLVFSDKQRRFGSRKWDDLPRSCRECEFLFTCFGECPKNRIEQSPDGTGKINRLCPGLKAFFAHTNEPMRQIAELLRSGRNAAEITKRFRHGT